MSHPATQLAAWSQGLAHADVPSRIRTTAIRHLADGFGTAAAAARTGAVGASLDVARTMGGPPEASLLGTAEQVGAPAAALASGTLVHATDFDDTHAGGLVHATAVVLPAALAVAESVGASGRDLVSAAVVGYEVACRIAAATPHAFHSRGLHATSVAGTFAAALVTSRLVGLDVERATHALGIAGSSSGGLLEFLGSAASTKQLHPGLASMNGIIASRLAAAGATGPESVLDGARGLYAALAGRAPDLQVLTGGLGQRWETGEIGIKPYPACQLMHATLDATAAVMADHAVDPADVSELVAEVHPDSAAVVCDPRRDLTDPLGPYDAKFSLPWSVAAMLTDGAVTMQTYTADSVRRPDVRALAGRVSTVLAPADAAAADAPGRVRVRLHNGTELLGDVDRSSGGPASPMSLPDLRAKFLGNTGDRPPAHELWEALLHLDDVDDVSTLPALFNNTVLEDD